MFHAQGHHFSAQVRVGSRVVDEAAVKGMQGPVGQGSQPVVHANGMALVARGEALFPLPPHLDGSSPRVHGRQDQQALNRGTVLSPEPASQVRGDDPHGVHLDSQGVSDFEPVPKRGLGRDDQDDSSVGLLPGNPVFGFEKSMLLWGDPEIFLHDHVAFVQGCRRVSDPDDGLEEKVSLLMNPGRLEVQGFLGVEHAGQGFDIRADEIQGRSEGFPVLGQHHRHGLGPVADLVFGQHRLVLVDDPLPVGSPDVPGRENRMHARQHPGFRRVDSPDSSVGDPGPLNPRPQEVVSIVVQGVFLPSRDLGRGIMARGTFSNSEHPVFHEFLPVLTWAHRPQRPPSLKSSSRKVSAGSAERIPARGWPHRGRTKGRRILPRRGTPHRHKDSERNRRP